VPRRIESFFVAGPAGRLEAILEEPEGRAPREAALVCHPHPVHGGTLHNKVVYRLARGLRRSGCAVLRFNFRGVNLSAGSYDEGRGEVEDARACLLELRRRYPGLPWTLAGFSFGSRVAAELAASLGEDGPGRLILAGFPTVYRQFQAVEQSRRPRVFIHSTNDEFGPRNEMQALYDRLWEPKKLIWIEARDHFFAGALDELERSVTGLGSLAGGASGPIQEAS
jgi:alpha/beta superfamily hydrolase